jgi:tRNA uridine 5-carboxymethylaminomethyl modification enzyme
MQKFLSEYPNLTVQPSSVFDICATQERIISGVRLGTSVPKLSFAIHLTIDARGLKETGEEIPCSKIVICTGTFLSGEIHIGM